MRQLASPLLPKQQKTLESMGDNIKYARLRRDLSMEQVAERAGISRATLHKVESGNPGVAIGAYLKTLYVLNLEEDLSSVARDDEFGRALQDIKLPSRKRASKSGRI
ncbi:MAG: helix-turn-helix domain-containing protein [Treponema sp.]|jgi:transcriptional regulator with XRE-family HTH domain|nr:helix-turn-helix domain-containing protein [Treponema sp.]